MVSRALATLDLVSHGDARPAFPAVHLEGQTVLSYGELAGLADLGYRPAAEPVAGTSAARMGIWPAPCASCSA
ncbi:MAG TPA: hypothetical protein VNO25_21520, partial [Streptosporangiaceae bacterium]|nr:hypothetical protein [Streptosporangiaceae bacterium]